MITLNGIQKVYRSGETDFIALEIANFTCSKGEMLAIVGESGSGKTTLLRILGLLDNFEAGSYQFNQQETAQLSAKEQAKLRNQEIGFVLQTFGLIEDYTVKENILLPAKYLPRGERAAKINHLAEIAEQLNISEQLKKYPRQLSRGQQQRVAFARALINDANLILADEPTGNLDSSNSQRVIDLLKQEHQKGKTVILVTHDQAIAQQCDRIVGIKDGKINENRHFEKE
ncbi:ABC transporter ATP-binding protein [Enterococcus sp. HY326]|uniref:ABC transporter ATP-binding protein n=1 Tax=Enterococcus sp. HY326 TaxID=2971265 RepID=UPI00223F3BB4|nr:ABC transporter ATP-binding protein [Enterococcus sp. HY326]